MIILGKFRCHFFNMHAFILLSQRMISTRSWHRVLHLRFTATKTWRRLFCFCWWEVWIRLPKEWRFVEISISAWWVILVLPNLSCLATLTDLPQEVSVPGFGTWVATNYDNMLKMTQVCDVITLAMSGAALGPEPEQWDNRCLPLSLFRCSVKGSS